jgi:hypothetical protein
MKIVSVGCSFTEGAGVGRPNSFTKYLADLCNCTYNNFGESGHSNQYIFRKVIELIKNWNNDDILLIQWTNPWREEIITNEGFLFYPPYTNWFSLRYFCESDNIDEGLIKKGILEKKDIFEKKVLKEKSHSVSEYSDNFFNEKYLDELSFCFQLSLYGLLEILNIKYIMFFGWDFYSYDKQKEIFNYTNEKFLKQSFGNHANIVNNYNKIEKINKDRSVEHPDLNGHINWANHLYNKCKEFNYV